MLKAGQIKFLECAIAQFGVEAVVPVAELVALAESNGFANTDHHWLYMNDQYWKCLQPISAWFCLNKRIGIQRSSYSDNSKCIIFHGM